MLDLNIQKEDNNLLYKCLDELLYGQQKRSALVDYNCDYSICKSNIELTIRPDCNQGCEYCYLQKHKEESFPHKLTKDETLHNVELILDYLYIQKKVFPIRYELFAGDLFYDNIWFDIMDLFDKYFKNIKSEFPGLFDLKCIPHKNKKYIIEITIPSNLQWVYTNPEQAKKALDYIKYFYDEYKVLVRFSWSTDGLYAVDSREKANNTQEYFDVIGDFCAEANVGMHPMIAPSNIANWCKNLDWWVTFVDKINKKQNTRLADWLPMMLEVRDENWDDTAISNYIKFLDYLFDVCLKHCNNDIELLTKMLYRPTELSGDYCLLQYNPIRCMPLSSYEQEGKNSLSCDIDFTLFFNCTNLSLIPCHRLAYKNLTAGHFITDEKNEHIIDVEADNITFYLGLKYTSSDNYPVCCSCELLPYCHQGCLGAQYEYSGEAFLPIPNVCKLLKAKHKHIFELYEKYGIIDCAYSHEYITDKDLNLIKKIKEM